MKLIRTTIASAALTVSVCALAFGCICLGFKLERAAYYYAKGQSQETLKALYTSVDWASVVEDKNRQLKAVCRKLTKKQKKGVCPVEST